MTGMAGAGRAGEPTSGVTLALGYRYNQLGQKISMVYPSGKVVAITYGPNGKQSAVSYNGSAVANGIAWDANDRLLGWTFGMTGLPAASQNVSMTYDWDGQLSALNDIDARTYSYNNNGQATGIADSASAHSQSFGYSSSRRLTFMSVGNWSSPLNYAYDATGNETRKSDSTSGKNFTLATSSNRISATYPDGSSPTSWTYDAMGNLVTDAVSHTLSYDVKGRLAQAIFSGSLAQYTYDAFGNRKTKIIAGTGATSVIFMEGDDGELLGSYTPTGSGSFAVQEELVALDNGRTIATIRPSPTAGMSAPIAYPILTDQLGIPRKVLSPATGAVIWLWDSKEAYGYQSPNEDPGSTGQPFHLNARMPGQELDAETGFFHNGFRDYDPASGRYVESDPLGLAAGWNTYAYVGGDPVMRMDPFGLACKGVGAGLGCWLTPSEKAYAATGNYSLYYQAACSGGDSYACSAGLVAVDRGILANITNQILRGGLKKNGETDVQCDTTMDDIRVDLARAHAKSLRGGGTQGRPHVLTPDEVSSFHHDVFSRYYGHYLIFGGDIPGSNFLNWCSAPSCRP
jgi:RHS repeat-associated protein